jgi:NAD-dependent deacetylase
MFGGMLNEELLTRAQEVAAQSDVFLVVGTSAAVYPAADLPTIETRRVPRSSRST